jgi:hypothetical protein
MVEDSAVPFNGVYARDLARKSLWIVGHSGAEVVQV